LFISSDGKKAYYSDEKLKENGIDYLSSTLMAFDMPAEATVKYKSNYLKGTVYDAKTKQKIKAEVELFNINNNQREALVQSDPINGSYMIVLTQGAEYALEVSKKGYTFKSAYFNYILQEGDTPEPVVLDIYLDPIEKGVKFTLNNIFFDTGEYRLKDKSKAELDKLIQFMLENEQVRGEISGHTDNVGDAQANVELSLKRAKSVYEYLQSNGIAANRLVFKGYGQSQPAAPNDNEENRQRNRRIEFKIL
jgi:outer membrane protein OmpA-like peptidoglycan-associated protein